MNAHLLADLGINWTTPFILGAIYGGLRYFARSKKQDSDGINWTIWESIGVTLGLYFGGQVIGALLVYVFPLIAGVSQTRITDWLENNVYGQFILIAAVETVTFLLLFKFIKRRGSSLSSIGLKKPKLRDAGFVFIGFAVYFASFLLISNLVQSALPQVNQNQKQIIGFDGAKGGQLPFVFVSLVVLPPLVEELVMRGFLYSGLKKRMNLIWAALITSALFATAHLQAGSGEPLLWSAAMDTFVLSCVLIYLKEKTGSLWASIGLHMLKNFVAFMSIFVFHLT